MRKNLISEKSKDRYKQKMDQFIASTGRYVSVYKTPIKSECGNCYFDSLTNKSTGKCKWTSEEASTKQRAWELLGNSTTKYKFFIKGRCPICSGTGYIELMRRKNIKCIVNWDPSLDEFLQTQAGNRGSNIALLKTNPAYLDLFNNSTKIVIDNIECVLATPPLLRGAGNDSVLFVYVFTNKHIDEVPSSDKIKKYYN